MTSEIKGPLEFQREMDRMLQGVKFRSVKPTAPYFRPGIEMPVIKRHMIFRGSGMGDYICYMPAMVWLAKNCPWVFGRIFVYDGFVEFAKNIMDQTGHPDWEVHSIANFLEVKANDGDVLVNGPGVDQDFVTHGEHGVSNPSKVKLGQLANGTGGHLVHCGFLYWVNLFPTPLGAQYYPQIDFEAWIKKAGPPPFEYDGKPYVVFTTGSTAKSRTVPGQYWNPIIDWVIKQDLHPVFLGTDRVSAMEVKFPDGCNYGMGTDLRNQTTLMEAAWIMANSKAVVGLDNGLIHLAGCTNANIVAAYNMVHPKDRIPYRRASHPGKIEIVYLDREELECTGCQSFIKMTSPHHNFQRCLYADNKCIDLLFDNQGQRFIKALERIL